MRLYLINAQAMRDLDEIAEYRGNLDLDLADQFLQDFDRKCGQIAVFPMSGKAYSQLKPGLRGISWSGYVIFCRLMDDVIEIMRVLSRRRDLCSIFSSDQ
jgi:toxin ParE1/3/4